MSLTFCYAPMSTAETTAAVIAELGSASRASAPEPAHTPADAAL